MFAHVCNSEPLYAHKTQSYSSGMVRALEMWESKKSGCKNCFFIFTMAFYNTKTSALSHIVLDCIQIHPPSEEYCTGFRVVHLLTLIPGSTLLRCLCRLEQQNRRFIKISVHIKHGGVQLYIAAGSYQTNKPLPFPAQCLQGKT